VEDVGAEARGFDPPDDGRRIGVGSALVHDDDHRESLL
jgi:hypothetical protein